MKNVQVVRDDGTSGRVLADANSGRVIVEFDDGEVVVVPSEALVPQTDGTQRLPAHAKDVSHTTSGEREVVIPVIAEELTVEKARVARGRVRVNKRVETSDEIVQTPTIQEEVRVDRIPINQFVDTPPAVHEEGDVLVIPVVEEVLVVEKKLRVREEVRVTKKRTSTSGTQTVTLRREVVDVEREDLEGTELPPREGSGDDSEREG
jgi:uncharacterized protein (TIGR02271 family)